MRSNNIAFRARLVLLGASNLTRGISTVIETAQLMLGSPLEIIAAMGHGRSFGMRSRVLIRDLPGILDCGLWDALNESRKQRPDLPTFGLITDIGNDVMYGQSPATIESWVEQCIDRLQQHGVCLGMTMLPIESIQRVTPWQYKIVKMMLFPTRELTYEQAMQRARELHDRIVDLARRGEIELVELAGEWYGFDPIHIRMPHWATAWRRILSHCRIDRYQPPPPRTAHGSFLRWARLRLMMPQHYRLLGREFTRTQPAGRLPDGTTVALY